MGAVIDWGFLPYTLIPCPVPCPSVPVPPTPPTPVLEALGG